MNVQSDNAWLRLERSFALFKRRLPLGVNAMLSADDEARKAMQKAPAESLKGVTLPSEVETISDGKAATAGDVFIVSGLALDQRIQITLSGLRTRANSHALLPSLDRVKLPLFELAS